jgi:hypothetical protein
MYFGIMGIILISLRMMNLSLKFYLCNFQLSLSTLEIYSLVLKV